MVLKEIFFLVLALLVTMSIRSVLKRAILRTFVDNFYYFKFGPGDEMSFKETRSVT